ncbi:unnamed protein product [Leuciscus chuanchicus]
MARQGVSRPKVVSSGRLTGSGRGQIQKKRFAGRCVPPLEPAYSLYSTDSEDQVTTIHKGLDRCAALFNGILQAEQAESKPKQQGTKTCTFKSKPKNLSRQKKHGKKTTTAIHVKKGRIMYSNICTSQCVLSSGGSSGEFHQSRAMSAAIPSCPHASEEMSATPNQYVASFSMPPAVQRQSPVTVSPVQNGFCTPVGHGLPIITSPGCSVQVKLTSSTGSLICPSATQTPNQLLSAEDEDEKHGMDNTAVRDISCQTSYEKLTVLSHKVKPSSPEKTAQKVVTVKYLLRELKLNDNSEAVRLISEVEQRISLLPVMVGSTNIQAEIALALQPLRMVALQSLNFTLQTQLNESCRELDDLEQENMRLRKAMEKSGEQTKDTSKYSPQQDLCQSNSQLTKSVLELHENAQRESTVSDQLSNSVKTYLQTLEGIGLLKSWTSQMGSTFRMQRMMAEISFQNIKL